MKSKLPLTNSDRETLVRCIALAKEQFKIDAAEETKRENIKANYEQLAAEVSQLEKSFDGSDMNALRQLTEKNNQLSLLSSKMDSFGNAKKASGQYHGLMMEMNEILAPFFNIEVEKLKEEARTAFRPFYQTDAAAREQANQAHCVALFYNWRASLVSPGNPKRSVNRLVEAFEKMLAGKDIWKFEPNMKDTPAHC